MQQLKYKLWVEGSTVKFQVLEMPEEIRGKMLSDSKFVASNGLIVLSSACPEINNYSICLRGNYRASDSYITICECAGYVEACVLVSRAHDALADFAANYKLPKSEPTPDDDPNVVTLTFTN
jgi:hypothetical protein